MQPEPTGALPALRPRCVLCYTMRVNAQYGWDAEVAIMPAKIKIGSQEHLELFCRSFIDTHDPYDIEKIEWPELDRDTHGRLAALPFWNEAVSTEGNVALKVQALVPLISDPLLREAIALQGFEEGRHSALLGKMTSHYGIEVPPFVRDPLSDAEWDFIRTGYGECFDSFFAFGLFSLAGESGFFPPALLRLFEPIIQEEARHILFFVNWIAYRRVRHPLFQRPHDLWQTTLALALQVWARIQTARGAQTDDFLLQSTESVKLDITFRGFLERCLQENDRRLRLYDQRLLRPRLVPGIAGAILKVSGGRRGAATPVATQQ